MLENIIPVSEALRLEKLLYYDILNSPAEISFDRISGLVIDIFDVNHAGICFISEDDVFIKSQIGNPLGLTRNDLLIPLSTEKREVFIAERETITENGKKSGFFIAAPICSPDGFNIGVVYAFGNENKAPSNKQEKMLAQLADFVVDQLETRIAIRKTLTAQDDRLHVLIHDLKNPMTTISLQSELVSRMPGIDEKANLIASKINLQSKRMVNSLNEILSSAKKVSGSYKPQKVLVDLREILHQAIERLQPISNKKDQSFILNIDTKLEIYGDKEKLTDIFYHIIHNAIKFSDSHTAIAISYQTEENLITIAIKDQGVGLTSEDLELLFIKFAKLSAEATHHENSNGLGLTLVKMLIDMHKGKLWAESKGKDKGTTFYVQLPIK